MDEALGTQIEDMAGLQFTDAEIARIVGLSPDALNEYRDNIDRGRLLAEAEVRRAINKAAKLGDAAAIKQFLILNDRTKSFVL